MIDTLCGCARNNIYKDFLDIGKCHKNKQKN